MFDHGFCSFYSGVKQHYTRVFMQKYDNLVSTLCAFELGKPMLADIKPRDLYLRDRSALAMNCCIIIHCLEVSCKEDQITSAQRE